MFHIATADDIKAGRVTDVYFLRTLQVLKAEGLNPLVSAEVRTKSLPEGWDWGVYSGLEECLTLLEGLPLTVRSLPEGSLFRAGEPVLEITGPYAAFCALETSILGLLCQSSGISTRAARLKRIAGHRTLLSFGARRMHPAIAPMIDRAAFIGGFDGVSVPLSAERIGIAASGTMPHALILILGDTVKAALAYHKTAPRGTPRVVLIDTLLDEKFEAIRVAKALGRTLSAVRLDTPGSRRGNFSQILKEVRWELNLRGFDRVGLFASGGLTEDALPPLNPHADGYGIGTHLSNAPVIDFAMDIVEIAGIPMAKRGKESGRKSLRVCSRCGLRSVLPMGAGTSRCPCGGRAIERLTSAIKNGKIMGNFLHTAGDIRASVLADLAALDGHTETSTRRTHE